MNNKKKIPGKCSAYGCRTGYDWKKKIEEETENVVKIKFPLKKPDSFGKFETNCQFESGSWKICCKLRKKTISKIVVLDEVKG